MKIGSHYLSGRGCDFIVWSPSSKSVEVRIVSSDERMIPMRKDERGYWRAHSSEVGEGALYFYRLDGTSDRPDPASCSQPRGVHGPSAVVDHNRFEWGDANWRGIEMEEAIIYELHVGTFTPEGTFGAITPRLGALKELGVNTVEIMPIAQFPGGRNWGYDGAYPFAAQDSYGGPEEFKRLVDACHSAGIAVILDVVYNHLGPEGNYIGSYAPYFTKRYKTPWGNAINFDDAYSDDVRNYFIENALYWLGVCHVDGLRLDAVHEIYDMSAKPFLLELQDRVEQYSSESGRKHFLIAESDLNDARLIRPKEVGGYGLAAQWSDDFHHSLHALVTGERGGYYSDFGELAQMAKAFKEGFVYDWRYSRHRLRHHGSSSTDVPGHKLVVCSQNHDQVGNRMLGERLARIVSFEALKLVAGVVLLAPYVPLLFMGEEYGEQSPFLYFVSHGDGELAAAVREGRRAEFKAFAWQGEPPDPQGAETFLTSKLRWELRDEGRHKTLLGWYRRLIQLRRATPALARADKSGLEVTAIAEQQVIIVHRSSGASRTACAISFNPGAAVFDARLPAGIWEKVVDSSDETWVGPGSLSPQIIEDRQRLTVRPLSLTLYEMRETR